MIAGPQACSRDRSLTLAAQFDRSGTKPRALATGPAARIGRFRDENPGCRDPDRHGVVWDR